MRAAYYESNGSAREVLRVGEADTPQAGPGEVRVKLATSGVNPSDVKSRQGATRKIAWPRVVPQSDGAGVIDRVGDGVAKSRIGERVWVWNGQWTRAFGTAAEYIALPAAQAVKLPDKIGFEAGACLGIPAMTGYHAIALSHATKGTTLLISGGAGAVSQYAIQFAKAADATVLATVSSPEKAKAAQDAGADHTINYKSDDVGARVMEITGNRGVDAVIEMDLAANVKLIPAVLRPKGSVLVYGTTPEAAIPAAFCLVNTIRLQFFLVYELDAAERERTVTGIARALEQGKLVNRIAQPTYALADIAVAHEAVERGTIGNVVVTI
ncbi:MAG TPA: NADPH:quinone reductase [Pseudolabrys sp.]|nr:NADPH:quinone reductase [Pseudolabrys sp.]